MTADLPATIDAELGADLASCALAVARRFAAGATMWCLSPTWPEHARHVAVEFVHPVVVGKRALPAVSVDGPDPIASLRSLARPGDVLLVVSPAEASVALDAVRRAPAWGLTSIWVGAGPRPDAGAADHVLWLADAGAAPAAGYDGRLVLVYHVLWELAHVCFEHPGLLVLPPPGGDVEGVCTTCSDEGRLGEVVAVDAAGALIRTGEGRETIDTTIVGPVQPGDLVLVHAGTAIALVPAGSS